MVSVELPGVVLTSDANPSDRLVLPRWVVPVRSPAVKVDKQLAVGRVRSIVGAVPVPQTWAITIEPCGAAARRWLEDHRGVLVCVRDMDGNKMFGDFDTVASSRMKVRGDEWTVSLTITETTHSEVAQ